jgi:hypothetical protein
MKLTGRYKIGIGIVLSVLWCFFIIHISIQDYTNQYKSGFFVTLEPDTTKPIPPTPDPSGWVDDIPHYKMKPVINYGNIIYSMIYPVGVGWILVFTIIWTIKWIIRGFKKKEP